MVQIVAQYEKAKVTVKVPALAVEQVYHRHRHSLWHGFSLRIATRSEAAHALRSLAVAVKHLMPVQADKLTGRSMLVRPVAMALPEPRARSVCFARNVPVRIGRTNVDPVVAITARIAY